MKNPGAQATMDAVSAITGLKVNYYALIDLKGFQSLINAVGGITVDVKQRVPIGGETTPISGYINVGTQHLTGYRALWYARSRTGSSDYARMARQRCVMTAMLQQLNPETVLLKFNGIASASSKVISTSIPEGDLGTFVDLAIKAKSQKVTSVQFVPPLVVPKHPDFAAVQRLGRHGDRDGGEATGLGVQLGDGQQQRQQEVLRERCRQRLDRRRDAAQVDAKAVCSAG